MDKVIENFEINKFLSHDYPIEQLNHCKEVYPSWTDKPKVPYVCSKFSPNPFGMNSLFHAIANARYAR